MFAVASTALLVEVSSAALVPHDLASASDGLLTYDTATQLEWLDLPLTAGLAYVRVQPQLTGAGAFAGFRYATETEVMTLFAHAGLTITFGAFVNIGEREKALTFIQLAGQTGFASGGFPGPATRGIYGEASNNAAHPYASIGIRNSDGFTSLIVGASPTPISFADTDSNEAIGSFLVRTAPVAPAASIPTITTVGVLSLCLAIGLSALAALRRRRSVHPWRP